MERDSSDKFNLLGYFILGLGVGVVGSLYYSNIFPYHKIAFTIKLTDNNNNSINKDFHLNESNYMLYFKEEMVNVNIKILLDNKVKYDIKKFTGKQLNLNNC